MISDDQIQRMRNSPPREICEHGSQKVKCAHCDNAALETEITALRSQVADLRAGQANDDRDYRALMERAIRTEADRDDWHLHYTQAMQSLHKAEVERDALKQDADRYRWLRDECDTSTGFLLAQRLEADEWDAAIDEARTKENQP